MTSADIYTQHDKAFELVSAYVILTAQGTRVATVAIKFPRDGAGRVWAYTHFLGVPMTRHHASGYGYDKRTPAVCGGFLKADLRDNPRSGEERQHLELMLNQFKSALDPHSGTDWTAQLERAGYQVLQAV